MAIQKTIKINQLLDCYEEILSPKQKAYMTLYYREDLSLSEIAAQLKVSRNAVHDNLKRTEELLNHYESKLHLVKIRAYLFKMKAVDQIDEIRRCLKAIDALEEEL